MVQGKSSLIFTYYGEGGAFDYSIYSKTPGNAPGKHSFPCSQNPVQCNDGIGLKMFCQLPAKGFGLICCKGMEYHSLLLFLKGKSIC